MRICFKMVDFPDSPAPGMGSVKMLEEGGKGSHRPSNRIFTCRAWFFLSLRSSLSISMFFLFSSLVDRCRAFPPPLLVLGKHMLNTMGNTGRVRRAVCYRSTGIVTAWWEAWQPICPRSVVG